MTDKILIDRAVVESALQNICAARLCEINSMSSRQEMLRLMIRATDALRTALEQQKVGMCRYPDCKCPTENPCLKGLQLPTEHVAAIDTTEKRVEKTVENVHEPVAWMDSEGRVYFHDITETCKYHGFPLPTLLYPHPPAAPEQEPVAWRTFDGEGGYDYRTYDDNENYRDEWERRNPSHKGWVEPLYLHPSRRECDDLYSLLERAEVEMRYAGWGRRQEDNFGRFEVYSQVLKALKEKNT